MKPQADPQALFARALAVTPGGVHSPVRSLAAVGGLPFFTRRVGGAWLEDTGGRRLLDFCMAFGPLILGHAPAPVTAAVADALADGWSYGTAEPYSLALAEFIAERLPWAGNIRFVNSGTEAVMSALRLARGATGRERLLKFAGCYHGHADAMLIRTGSGLAASGIADSAGVPAGVAADTVVAPLDDADALEACFATHGPRLAAAIIEPLPANHGLLPQQAGFLRRLRELCTQHGVLLIFDEVISGFRVGFGGMAAATGITPDLVTWGKIIGGGFPVGAVAGSRELMAGFAPLGRVYQAGTLSANPLAMRAGLAALQVLDAGEVYRQLEALGERLESGVRALGLHVARVGSIFWIPGGLARPGVIRSPAQIAPGLTDRYAALFRQLLQAGVYLPPSPLEVGFLSTAHDVADVDRLVELLAAARA
ncbi:glutamate-1-semialdehyde 2,1-aminomutase [Gammaproteobacteria bacterium]|nr:glutamate-1-semialdehyde 2,1-aminomutase [Gammaproteobacteria bacterium]